MLRYPGPAAAAAAHAAMTEGRAGNVLLEQGTRIEGDAIVLAFDGVLASSDPARVVEDAKLGIEKALENATTGTVTCSAAGLEPWVKHALGHEFWAKRWTEGQTAFHEGRPNDLLAAHVARLETKKRLRVFVPLAGKAFDLRWLAARGHEVVGVEFVWDAIKAFFDEQGVAPQPSEIGGRPALGANGVTLVCGDVFDASPRDLGRFDVVYDRAALVALEPSTRTRYVETCRALLAEGGVTFLVAFAYDQSKTPGPPWSIDEATVRALHAGLPVEILATRSVPTSKRLSEAGIAALEETAYRIGPG